MKNSKLRRALLLVACAVMLVSLSVGATLAYLTATTGTVDNTFTVGNVSFDDPELGDALDELDVDQYGDPVQVPVLNEDGTFKEDEEGNTVYEDTTDRVTANEYKLIPGHTYIKDPTVHMSSTTEEAWLFVKVDNGIAGIEATGTTSISEQMKAKDWTQIENTNIWWYKDKVTANQDIVVFETFTLQDGLNETTLNGYASAKITIQAYAVQADGFDTALDAWADAPLAAWQ